MLFIDEVEAFFLSFIAVFLGMVLEYFNMYYLEDLKSMLLDYL